MSEPLANNNNNNNNNNNSSITPPFVENNHQKKEGGEGDKVVKESTIRKMTRLANEYSAINLSQGFPNEAPPISVRYAMAHAVLTGAPIIIENGKDDDDDDDRNSSSNNNKDAHYESLYQSLISSSSSSSSSSSTTNLMNNENKNGISRRRSSNNNNKDDTLNQYSPPMGRNDVRNAIASYYMRLYGYGGTGTGTVVVDPDINITVTLGATEALAVALRSLGRPGDKVVIFEPFHELYPSQCHLFYLEPIFVTLKPTATTTTRATWTYNVHELELALQHARILVLNTPHNPTGKVFTRDELQIIVNLCLKYQVYIVTDEIYEHMCYDDDDDDDDNDDDNDQKEGGDDYNHHHNHHNEKHILLPQAFPEIANWCLVCNSLGKSASATGWRLGWCLHPTHISSTYRGIHDQIAVMSPHPVQYAAITYLNLPTKYFRYELRTKYKSRIHQLSRTLSKLGFGVIKPQSAYYLFVTYGNVKILAEESSTITTPLEAAMFLLKNVGVACVPGDNFYGSKAGLEEEGPKYLRFAACRSEDDITEACARLEKYLTVTNE